MSAFTTSTTAPMNCAAWHLDDVHTTTRGAKVYRATSETGRSCTWIPKAQVRAPFGPSTFDKDADATRLNLDICLEDPELLQEAEQLDKWAIEYLVKHSERLFKKQMTEAQVRAAYTSCVKPPRDSKYSPMLKTKVDRQGARALKVWTADGEPGAEPLEWRRFDCKVAITISHLWQMGGSFGLVLQTTDVQLFPREGMEPAQRSNPFA